MPSNPSSARKLMSKWKKKPPNAKHRVLIEHAIILAGNEAELARILGITRSSVYQWREPYRLSPYMPKKMAERILAIEGNAEKLREMEMDMLHKAIIN